MRVLVTGGAGFLGRHFAMHHATAGDKVLVVDDFSSPYADWPEHANIDTAMTDAAQIATLPTVPDLVYHFAAPVGGREKIEGDPLFNADSLRLDAALFRWAVKHPQATIVYPSSSAVYGAWRQSHLIESGPLSEDLFHPTYAKWDAPDEMYGFTKMTGEVLAHKAAQYGVNTLCIRPFSGYGEDQSLEYPVPSIIARVKARENPIVVWGNGEQARDFIHVDDVVAATVARLDAGIEGYQSMNIGWGIPTSFNTLAMLAADLSGHYARITHLLDKPVGVGTRYCDPHEMLQYYSPRIDLTEGIKRMLA